MKQIKVIIVFCLTLFLAFLSGRVSAMDQDDLRQKTEMQIVGDFLENIEEPADWATICRAIVLLGERRNESSKKLLVAILQRETPLKLVEGSQFPGVMSPLDMLKTAALDTLGKLKAYEYLDLMKEVYQKAGNPTQHRIAKENIEALGGSLGDLEGGP